MLALPRVSLVMCGEWLRAQVECARGAGETATEVERARRRRLRDGSGRGTGGAAGGGAGARARAEVEEAAGGEGWPRAVLVEWRLAPVAQPSQLRAMASDDRRAAPRER